MTHVWSIALMCILQQKQEKRDRAAVDGVFFRRLIRILKILVPGWLTPEVRLVWSMAIIIAEYKLIYFFFHLCNLHCGLRCITFYIYLITFFLPIPNYEYHILMLCIFQTWYVFLVAASLAARTYADIWMIQNGTLIERWGLRMLTTSIFHLLTLYLGKW